MALDGHSTNTRHNTDTGHNSHKQQAPFSNPTMYMFPNVAANLFGEIMKNVSCPTDFLTTVAKDLILKVCCATIRLDTLPRG